MKVTLSVIKADVGGYVGHSESHRLPLEEMEYTTMPEVAKKLEGRFSELD